MPAKGEALSASPTQVSITFTQDVQKITGTYGIEVHAEPSTPQTGIIPPATDGPTILDDDDRSMMTVQLAADLPSGRYVVRWKNVSDTDGDTGEGAFSFYVRVQPTEADLAADAALEGIGGESTPTAGGPASTPDAGDTSPASSATATPPAGGDDNDGGGSVVVIIAIVAVALGAAVGFFGVRWFARRRA